MILNEIRETIEENLNGLQVTTTGKTINGINYVILGNLNNLRHSLMAFDKLGAFAPRIHVLMKKDFYNSNLNEMMVTLDEANEITTNTETLKELLLQLRTTVRDVLGIDIKENSVYIKFPPTSDFNDLAKYATSFQLALSQVILDEEIGGKIKIESVDNGSIWFVVLLGSTAAVTIVGTILRSAALVIRDFKLNSQLDQVIRSNKLTNDMKEKMQEVQGFLLDNFMKQEAEYIDKNLYQTPDSNNERPSRILVAIKEIAMLLEQGGEIKPALSNSQDVIDVFPDLKNLPGIQSVVKKLENPNPTDL